MQEGLADSFSFEDSRKHKQALVRNTALEELKKMEDRLLLKNEVQIDNFEVESGAACLADTAT